MRGVTDGSHLTALGVPTPNLFTGMQNIHSPLEWVSVQDMALAVEGADRTGAAVGAIGGCVGARLLAQPCESC